MGRSATVSEHLIRPCDHWGCFSANIWLPLVVSYRVFQGCCCMMGCHYARTSFPKCLVRLFKYTFHEYFLKFNSGLMLLDISMPNSNIKTVTDVLQRNAVETAFSPLFWNGGCIAFWARALLIVPFRLVQLCNWHSTYLQYCTHSWGLGG